MAARGLISTINAIARESARAQRRIDAENRRRERENARFQKQREREDKLRAKEEQQQYIEFRIEETEDLNIALAERIDDLKSILDTTLSVDDTIRFDSLRISEKFNPSPLPQELAETQPPDRQIFLNKVKLPGLLERALGLKKRHERERAAAEAQYQAALIAHNEVEQERAARRADFLANQEKSQQSFLQKARLRNDEVAELEAAYTAGDATAVVTYNEMVLEQSKYPEEFPQSFRIAYAEDSKQLVVDYDLPKIDVIPTVAEHKYIKAKNLIDEKPRKVGEIKELYQDVVAAVALRTLHEVLEADQGRHIDIVAFNGFVHSIDPATGNDINPCLISVRTTRDTFAALNLAHVDKRACLRSLGAHVSSHPQALQPVKPIVEFNMIDKRFIEQEDFLNGLESRKNLMDLSPSEFETLVSNLFNKMGLETKLTRASRDGGVDAIAFDTRPVLGGKIVIQAKRYKNTVGVSAVRDLYGTMLNEGASKGILVATSGYGPDAFGFANDKPIELIDGGGLLYLLEQVGIRARIVIPPS